MAGRRDGRAFRGIPVLLAASLITLSAQEPAQLEPFRTEVNYIRVDMYPTADGKPLTDLRQDEVEILDQGTLQKIDRFEHVMVRGARSQESRLRPSRLCSKKQAKTRPARQRPAVSDCE